MNMFRNLLTVVLVALGIGLWVSNPDDWKWAATGGPYVVNALHFLGQAKPFSIIILLVIATSLFMTRKQF
jgi:hypothetical protein